MFHLNSKTFRAFGAVVALATLALPCIVVGSTISDLMAAEPSPYRVGFKTIEAYDYTRTFRASRDYFGNPIEGETARPVQICMWYPSEAVADAQPLTLGEYAFPYPERQEFFNFVSRLQDRENMRMQGMLRGLEPVLSLFSNEVEAVRGAPEVEGKFPVVIYAGDRSTGIIDNSPLCEYLASFGFVVVGLHSVGTSGLTPVMTVRDLETQARDMEFALAEIRNLPNADMSHVAVAGRGQGAQAAVLVGMRNSSVSAVVVLGGLAGQGEGSPALLEHPQYDASSLWVPLLHVGARQGMCDAFRFADRVEVTHTMLTPMTQTYYGVIALLRPDADRAQLERTTTLYEETFPSVRYFLAWKLEGDAKAEERLEERYQGNWKMTSMSAESRPPTSDELIAIIGGQGVKRAQEVLDKFGLPTEAAPVLDENVYNGLGYRFYQGGDAASGVVVLKWGTIAYPQSANAWDSYAEVSLGAGDREGALKAWRRSLKLLDTDTTANRALIEVLRQSIPQRISELEGGNQGQ